MTLHAPQIIILILMAIGMGVSLARYGERKRDCYDFSDILFGPTITFGLLYWGGFFG